VKNSDVPGKTGIELFTQRWKSYVDNEVALVEK
jgi:hypothetical protein